jgi:predicted peptidase
MIVATLMLAGCFLGVASEPVPMVPKECVELFEARTFSIPGGAVVAGKSSIQYRLFIPRHLKPKERCPLLLWLHGMGEGGDDNYNNLKYMPMVLKDMEHIEQYRFFILVPQCPSSKIGWTSCLDNAKSGTSGVEDVNDMLGVTHELLMKTMREQPVDQDRVYLIGICSGGNACWEMANRHPGLFAAMSPMTPGGGDVTWAAKMVDFPIWAFHNAFEHPEGTQAMVDAVRQAGGNIHLTMDRSGQHDSWDRAFRYYDIIGWMLAQRRNAWICWTPPGHRVWKWWQVFGMPVAFSVIVGLGWYSERRHRRSKMELV